MPDLGESWGDLFLGKNHFLEHAQTRQVIVSRHLLLVRVIYVWKLGSISLREIYTDIGIVALSGLFSAAFLENVNLGHR